MYPSNFWKISEFQYVHQPINKQNSANDHQLKLTIHDV